MTNSSTESMSFIVNRKAMYEALNTLTPAISTRSTLPILANVLIEANEHGITLRGTNLEIGNQLEITDCTVVSHGSLTVNHKELLALVKSIQDEEVYFSEHSTSQSDVVLLIEATGVHITLDTMDSSEYPLIPALTPKEMQTLPSVTLPIETLRKMVTLTQYAAADDDSRPVFTGISVHLRNDALTFAAADAFRLAVITEKIEEAGSWALDVLIPAQTLISVCKQLPKATRKYDPGNVTLTISQNRSQATFTRDGYTLVTRLIDGTFPRYEQIIPQQSDCIAEVDVPALKRALDTVKSVAKDSSNITRFTVNGHIDVSAQHEERKLQVAVPAQTSNTEGETLEILLNYQYVLDFLAAHPQGTMQLEIQKPTKHVLTWNATQPKDETSTKPAKVLYPDTPGFVGVIMPMHINR